MMREDYIQAVELNNKGASFLVARDFSHANDAFLLAMNSLAHGLTRNDDNSDTSMIERKSTVKWLKNPSCNKEGCDDVSMFVFRHTILIQPADLDDAFDSDCHEEATSIMWNIGLCFHIMAISHPKTKYLRSALKFYMIAINIRRRGCHCGPDLLDLALQNNIGQIYMELMEDVKALACFERVTSHIGVLHGSGFLNYIDSEISSGFIMNALMAKQTKCAAVA